MKVRFSVLAVLALCGCVAAPKAVVTKPGVDANGIQSAVDACKIASFKEIPQSIASDYRPGFSTPGTVQCNTIGTYTTCQRVGSVNIAPSMSSYDVNQGLRDRYITQCLRSNGFTVQLP